MQVTDLGSTNLHWHGCTN